jgi:nuclear RNA export factor
MPASVSKLVVNPEAGALVLQFLEQYFLIYDSASRQGLLDAYHENAVMSLSATGQFPPPPPPSMSSGLQVRRIR